MPGFKLSKYTDCLGTRIAEHDKFKIIQDYEVYPEKEGFVTYSKEKFYLCFASGDILEIEGNNQNIEIIGSRED